MNLNRCLNAVCKMINDETDDRFIKPSYITLPAMKRDDITILEFLIERFPHVGKNIWLERINNGLVADQVGNAISLDTKYKQGMRLTYFREIKDEIVIPFKEEIIFQNDHLVAVCKPHFLPVQPSGPFVKECLLNRLTKKLKNKDLVPLHRIDRETAGVVLFSANPKSRNIYHELFRLGNTKKVYEAIGTKPKNDSENEWLIENRIVESSQWPLTENSDGPVNARTLIRKIDQQDNMVKFRIEPFTGKGHQIRLHLQLIGSNIINDRYHPELKPVKYDDFENPLQLIARALAFTDPVSGGKYKFKSSRKLLF